MRKTFTIVGIVLFVFLAINFLVGLAAPDEWAFEAAKARIQEEGGPNEPVWGTGCSTSALWIVGKVAIVEIETTTKRYTVTLRKPLEFLSWQVVDFKVGQPKGVSKSIEPKYFSEDGMPIDEP